jgi:Dit-like tail protein
MTIQQAYLTFTLASDTTQSLQTMFFDVVTDESWDGANIITEHPVETGSDVADNIRVGLRECQLTIFATNEPLQGNTTYTQGHTQNLVPQQTQIGPYAIPGSELITPDMLVAQEWANGIPFGPIATFFAEAYPFPFSPDLGLPDNPGIQQGVDLLAMSDSTIDFVGRTYELLELLRTTGTLITVYGSKNGCKNMAIESINMDRSAETGTGAEFIIKLKEIRFVTTQTVAAPAPTIKAAVPKATKGPKNPTDAPAPQTQSVAKSLFGNALKMGGGSPSADQLSATGLTQGDLPQ